MSEYGPAIAGRLGHMTQTDMDNVQEAIEVLQQLGLKEYEARCFVGLSRLESGTAKLLSELTEVPRTRVYDAIRALEAQGLVEVQHSSPRQFRAVSLQEATETLRDQYESRVERLQNALKGIEIVETDEESSLQQVWGMRGQEAIENRTNELIADATDEIVLVLGEESLLTDELIDAINATEDVDVLVGALNQRIEEQIDNAIPRATTFISGLDWLQAEADPEEQVAIGRLLLVDRSTILVSSIVPETGEEQAVFGGGFGNGLVVLARRLMAQGLLTDREPAR